MQTVKEVAKQASCFWTLFFTKTTNKNKSNEKKLNWAEEFTKV